MRATRIAAASGKATVTNDAGSLAESVTNDPRGRIPSELKLVSDEALAWDRLSRYARERGGRATRAAGNVAWELYDSLGGLSARLPWRDCLLHGSWRRDVAIRIQYVSENEHVL